MARTIRKEVKSNTTVKINKKEKIQNRINKTQIVDELEILENPEEEEVFNSVEEEQYKLDSISVESSLKEFNKYKEIERNFYNSLPEKGYVVKQLFNYEDTEHWFVHPSALCLWENLDSDWERSEWAKYQGQERGLAFT